MLRRQSSLNGLFGTVRLALHDQQLNSVLLHDWQRQDLHAVAKGALQTAANLTNGGETHQQTGSVVVKRRMTSAEVNAATVDFVASRKS